MKQKILIIEDNSDLSQFLASYLSDAGYEISRAGSLALGISKALAERPNLIIIDSYSVQSENLSLTYSCCQKVDDFCMESSALRYAVSSLLFTGRVGSGFRLN